MSLELDLAAWCVRSFWLEEGLRRQLHGLSHNAGLETVHIFESEPSSEAASASREDPSAAARAGWADSDRSVSAMCRAGWADSDRSVSGNVTVSLALGLL